MKAAADDLIQAGIASPSDKQQIKTTHFYVHFEVNTEEELEALVEQDTTLDFYPYPLDHELGEIDTAFSDTLIRHWYVTVPANYSYPANITYNVLESLYLPTDETDSEDGNFSDRLIRKSLERTGNVDPVQEKKKSWRPAGTILVDDDDNMKPAIGVEGVEVKARRWHTTHRGKTNKQGRFVCDGTFKREANYSFEWERYQFKIRGRDIDITGVKKKGDWNVRIRRNTFERSAALVFMAAHRYYYRPLPGLQRPPTNSFFKPQMKIKIYDEVGISDHSAPRRFLGWGNWIKINTKSKGPFGTRQTGQRLLYNTALHELAHASHWNIHDGSFSNIDGNLKESWAIGVAEELSKYLFNNFILFGDFTFQKMKDADSETMNQYTSLFVDLADNFNQGVTGTSKPFDVVSGYSLLRIEPFLDDCENFSCVQQVLIDQYNLPSEGDLPFLFQQHTNLSR